jgi:hypothetical protein
VVLAGPLDNRGACSLRTHSTTQLTCFTGTKVQILTRENAERTSILRCLLERSGARKIPSLVTGTQYTCFTGTKVQILTQIPPLLTATEHTHAISSLLYWYKSTNADTNTDACATATPHTQAGCPLYLRCRPCFTDTKVQMLTQILTHVRQQRNIHKLAARFTCDALHASSKGSSAWSARSVYLLY